MAEREDNVYKAKLAEQAERYDGKKEATKNRKKGLHQPWLTLGMSRFLSHVIFVQFLSHFVPFSRNERDNLLRSGPFPFPPRVVVRAIFSPRRIGPRLDRLDE